MSAHYLEFRDLLTKKTYRVPESQYKMFQIYRSRYVLGLSIIVLLSQFSVNLPVSIGTGLLFIGVSEYRYRKHFLKLCTESQNSASNTQTVRNGTMLLNLVLYLVLASVLIFYGLYNPDLENPAIIYFIAAVAFGIGLSYGYKYLTSHKK